ncbi:unnamed protein product [Bursaphelenchus xylophilus]|nr:unnamed protein product [Bursaphelenchus xylophilus]CAG9082487.1 unnamed protein product [Bursaphelenchus xylophilus]
MTSEYTDFIGMLLLAAVWGYTNVWMAKATREKKDNVKKDGMDTSRKTQLKPWYLRPFVDLWGHFKNWRFLLPFALNQSASVVFLYFVIKTDLSKAVCTINSLTFIFTGLFGYFFFGEKLDLGPTLLGAAFILAGIEMFRHFLLGFLLIPVAVLSDTDYYILLGVKRDADDRTIRRAFKKLAITKHPDKDPDNPEAHNEFIKINRAYEVLKDPELRRKYDQFGEKGLKDNQESGNQYQSWEFYNDKFGIYDDDPEIVTLNRNDFQEKVISSGDFWFINFYSTFCSHCHDLAPTWREFARKFHGTIKVGAVNCAEDPVLCQSQHVRGYPSLVVYPEHAFFQGQRSLEALSEFVTDMIKVEIHHLTNRNYESLSTEWQPYLNRPWLVDFCGENDRCMDKIERKVLAHKLRDVVNVATVNCGESQDRLCEKLRSEGMAFYPAGKIDKDQEVLTNGFEINEIYNEVIDLLNPVPELSDQEYKTILDTMEEPKEKDVLVIFTTSDKVRNYQTGDYKKLPYLAEETIVRIADCGTLSDNCDGLQLGALPKVVLFRASGHYLISYGRKDTMEDALNFLRSAKKSSMISLTENLFDELHAKYDKDIETVWMIDFFAPWCHPCMLALTELSQLPEEIESRRVKVGIIDCDVYKRLCQEHLIQSYPTSMLFYGSQFPKLIGYHGKDQIIEFIQEAFHPSVVELNPISFDEFIVKKQDNEIWVVDFFAPWCGPCQQLAPEFKKAARIMQEQNDLISFGTVNCDEHKSLCTSNGIRGYPTVRVYKMNGGEAFDYPQNWWRDHRTMIQWFSQFLPSVVEDLNDETMEFAMNEDTKATWIIDYWAPWCSHCIQFAPVYEQAARMLEGQVKFGKVNCVDYAHICAQAGVQAYPTIKLYSQGRRNPAGGIRLHAQDANQLVDLTHRILGQYGWSHNREEL